MSLRYPASFESRPVIGGAPRTNVNTPGFQLSAGVFLFGAGLLMFTARPPEGEWTRGMILGYRAGAWTAAILGGVLLLCAVQAFARAAARRGAFAAGSPDAWKLDYDWTPGFARDRAVAAALEAGFWILASGALGGGVLIFSAYAPEAGSFVLNALSLGLVGLCAFCAISSAGTVRRGLLFGNATLRWDGGGPLRAGREWSGTIEVAGGVAAPHAHLQFVKERRIDSGENVRYSRHEHDRIDASVAPAPPEAGGRAAFRVTARIPAGVPSTELSRDPARYWELRVGDDASGWSTAFLVPVYS